MAWLKFYEWETHEFRDSYDIKLSSEETKLIFKKLTRHFKINCNLYFKQGRIGKANRHYVFVPRTCPLGLLCHELAHVYNCQRYDDRGHNKRLKKTVTRFHNYCIKKKYWKDEVEKKQTVPEPKPEPTERELQQKKIEKRKADLERYQKRLAYFTKLYQNKIKKANRSISLLEHHLQKMQ